MATVLTNWTVATTDTGLHYAQRVLFGNAWGRLGVKDGDPIRTNAILGNIEDGRVVTASGSIYYLEGPACADFRAWHAAQVETFRGATANYYPWSERRVVEAAVTEVSDD